MLLLIPIKTIRVHICVGTLHKKIYQMWFVLIELCQGGVWVRRCLKIFMTLLTPPFCNLQLTSHGG